MGEPRKPAVGHMSGFTMVELITIMVIAGILAAMAIPRFFDRNVFDSRGFYDQVIATLRYAQKSAIAQHRFVCVAFTANSITVTYDPTAPSNAHTTATCPGSPLSSPDGEASYSVSSSQASFAATPASFSFDALGSPSFATLQSITVNGYGTPVRIEAETGYVH